MRRRERKTEKEGEIEGGRQPEIQKENRREKEEVDIDKERLTGVRREGNELGHIEERHRKTWGDSERGRRTETDWKESER